MNNSPGFIGVSATPHLFRQMPIRVSDYEKRTLIAQALDYYISYVIKNEFPHLTRDSYSEADWLRMLINDGSRH